MSDPRIDHLALPAPPRGDDAPLPPARQSTDYVPDECPEIHPHLLAYLEHKFRTVAPAEDWPERRVWMRAGHSEVVAYLRAEFDRQQRG